MEVKTPGLCIERCTHPALLIIHETLQGGIQRSNRNPPILAIIATLKQMRGVPMTRAICPDITPTRLIKETESINLPPIDAQGAQNGPADPQHAPSYTLQPSPPPSFADPSSGEINATTLQGQPSTPPQRHTTPPTCASLAGHVHRRDPAAPRRRDPSTSTW